MPLTQFCEQQIIPELNRPNVNELPVLKAIAIKFVNTFRTVLGAHTIVICIPGVMRHLGSKSQVVHSYAACTIEKILTMRKSDNSLNVDVSPVDCSKTLKNFAKRNLKPDDAISLSDSYCASLVPATLTHTVMQNWIGNSSGRSKAIYNWNCQKLQKIVQNVCLQHCQAAKI